jgi:ATP-dependent DNA helicase DinG
MNRPQTSANDILGPGGAIARRLPGYEPRAQQLEMAEAVEDAIANSQHLIAEAGTGVGKSFAYLVPAILAAQESADQKSGASADDEKDDKKRRIIVSTHTISLQEQLIQHDIPFLQSVMPVEFSAVLVKGRGNYISLRRMEKAVQRVSQKLLFAADGQRQLARITEWARTTTDGSRSDLSFRPDPAVWDEVVSDHGDCLRRKCPRHKQCFYYNARRRARNADLLIVNHALFFSDLSLRREGASILPDYQTVIFDEAHTIESVAASHLGVSLSEGQFDYLLNKLYNDRANRGLLVFHKLTGAQQLVTEIRHLCHDWFVAVQEWSEQFARKNGRLDRKLDIENQVSAALSELGRKLALAADRVKDDGDKVELTAASERCATLATELVSWVRQDEEGAVYWIEKSGRKRDRLVLVSAPVEVGPILRDQLFNKTPSVILTSATLDVGGGDFGFLRSRVGLSGGKAVRLGSPFDFKQQVRLILSSNMADPSAQSAQFQTQVCERLQRHLLDTQGRAFVLFTSYFLMQFCSERLIGWMAEHDLTVFCQGKGLPRSAMLQRFKDDPRAVLFGTDSFWQGVNVPGEALQNVIIPKLPFSVPDHPLLEARLESIRRRGGNPFREYQIPEAVIKLKQGFGRLIRHRNDQGRVVILDPRILNKPYGRMFVNSLPDCRLEIDDGNNIEPVEM